MSLDPQLALLLQALAEADAPPLHEGTPSQGRAAYVKLTAGARAPEHVVPVAATEDVTIPGSGSGLDALAARVYRPEAGGLLPTLVFFHGGGWVIGDLETHDNMARTLCRDCRAVVVSVDYRLAPEHPFPAATDDALAATLWAAGRLDELGGDDRLAVAGDSAGGNLAAVVTQQLRERGGPAPAGQLLIYPSVDVAGDYASRVQNSKGYFLELATMQWFAAHYAGVAPTHDDPRISPLHGRLDRLPPAVVVTAGYDPLRDEGETYAAALRESGVPVQVRRFDEMIHGFFDMGVYSAGAQAAIDETCGLFADVLHAD